MSKKITISRSLQKYWVKVAPRLTRKSTPELRILSWTDEIKVSCKLLVAVISFYKKHVAAPRSIYSITVPLISFLKFFRLSSEKVVIKVFQPLLVTVIVFDLLLANYVYDTHERKLLFYPGIKIRKSRIWWLSNYWCESLWLLVWILWSALSWWLPLLMCSDLKSLENVWEKYS